MVHDSTCIIILMLDLEVLLAGGRRSHLCVQFHQKKARKT